MKFRLCVILSLLLFASSLNGLSITQIGYRAKPLLENRSSVYVICSDYSAEAYKNEAKRASLILKKKVMIVTIQNMKDFYSQLKNLKRKFRKGMVLFMTDDVVLNKSNTAAMIKTLINEKIPMISDRSGDTFIGSMASVFENSDKVELHLNLMTAAHLKLKFPPSVLKETVIDIE